MKITFPNWYVILALVPNTVIFWTNSMAAAPATQQRQRCSQVDVIATNIIWSSPRNGWSLRNIYFSNGNGSFLFYMDNFFPLSSTRSLQGSTILVTLWVAYQNEDLLTHRFLWIIVLIFCLPFYCFVCLRFVSCFQCGLVSFNCPFLIVRLVVSYVNLQWINGWTLEDKLYRSY